MSYAIVGAEVRYRNMLVDRADVASFTPLGWAWAKDLHHVYAYGCRVDGASPATFEPLDAVYGRDGERVFAGSSALDADVATFRTLDGGYAVDARHAYYGELRLGWLVACWTLEIADPATFATRTCGWAVDRVHAYASGIVVPDADPAQLVALTRWFASDGRRAFADGRVIDVADPASLRALSEHYAIDDGHVFHADILWRAIECADRATFRPLGDFAADAHFLYWGEEVVAGLDPRSARVLSRSFVATDQQVHYFYSGIHRRRRIAGELWGVVPISLDGADPVAFRDTGELYGADASNAYYHSSRIALRGTARRFETLGARLARDDVAVYYEADPLDGVDPATFAIVAPGGIARDRERWYRYDPYGEYPMIEEVSADEARAILDGAADDPYADD